MQSSLSFCGFSSWWDATQFRFMESWEWIIRGIFYVPTSLSQSWGNAQGKIVWELLLFDMELTFSVLSVKRLELLLWANITILQIHDPEYWDRFKCQTCQRPFRDAHALKNHMQLHDGIKPHMCDLCGRTYNRFANMVCELAFVTCCKLLLLKVVSQTGLWGLEGFNV
jgi:hypothetical protein